MTRFLSRFAKSESGAVLVETIIAVPVMTLLTFGILEFGNMMWQRQQLQVGVRDAARYLSRCKGSTNFPGSGCSIAIARNIAFYGNPAGTGPARVPGWSDASELVITPATEADFPAEPAATDLIRVRGNFVYQGSPVYNAVFGSANSIGYEVTMRYQGW